MTALVVLGMHRSGTSCLAGMLAAAGLASAGAAVRNWDNARGHHEALDAVRLNEAVLAHSGGHWLSPPSAVRWSDDHAVARDRLLRDPIAGRPALLKDPRTLLCLPFWRASSVPFQVIGIIRHPLAAARSLEAWRGMPLATGVALWLAHNRMLAEDRAHHRYPLIDFEGPKDEVVAAVAEACRGFATTFDQQAMAAAYEEDLVHHDDGDAPAVDGLSEALALFTGLTGHPPSGGIRRPAFPRHHLVACERRLRAGDPGGALVSARAALAAVADAAGVLVPLVSTLLRHRATSSARQLVSEEAARLDPGLVELLLGKALLAAGDAASAARHLAAACAVPQPFFQARHLLPQALRQAGRHAESRSALAAVAGQALYPHGPLATLAEWSWLDGDPDGALGCMAQAIAVAPRHRRGRLRTRRAEWLLAAGDRGAARTEVEQALVEDPAYGRAREVLAQVARPS